MNVIRRLTGSLALVVLVAACSGSGAASPSVTPAPSTDPPAPSASVDPNAPVGSDPGASQDPGGNGGGLVIPKPGQIDPRPVAIDSLSATVTGRRVEVLASWTSGVEPCYVLDTVIVQKGDKSFTITLREGHGPGDVMCIEIAQMKQTAIDLGELEPGTYTISDGQRGAAAIEVTVT
jgi:ABC-type transport system substrate-binding protein